MKVEMELHPNFVSDIVVKQLQEMYEHTKEAYFYTDPEEARAAIAVVLDYFMPPSDYAQWRADNGFGRNLAEEVAEGFDHLEKEEVDRLRAKKKQIYEDLKDAVDGEWVGLTDEDIEHAINKWCEPGETARGMLRGIEAKLKEKNTSYS